VRVTGRNGSGRERLASLYNPELAPLRDELRLRIRQQEADHGGGCRAPDTLFGHLERVAALAVRLALKEGIDPLGAELAGLFHDAGKFEGGGYHSGDRPEEEYSVEILREAGAGFGLEQSIIDEVSDAIRQLYRDDPDPSRLGMILFDADNLDKLGPLGVANYFVKSGLRGRGISTGMIIQLTVELTYARHAPRCLYTATGRRIAARRAPETTRFIRDFLTALREDGLFDSIVEVMTVGGLELEVVSPAACSCGGALGRRTWETPGMKCREIHLELSCDACENRYEIHFCRPRLIG
jgi:HD superfamily phosphodiesterase